MPLHLLTKLQNAKATWTAERVNHERENADEACSYMEEDTGAWVNTPYGDELERSAADAAEELWEKVFLAFREALAWSQSTRAAPAGGLGDHLDYAFDRVVTADKSGYADHICEIICDLLEEEKNPREAGEEEEKK